MICCPFLRQLSAPDVLFPGAPACTWNCMAPLLSFSSSIWRPWRFLPWSPCLHLKLHGAPLILFSVKSHKWSARAFWGVGMMGRSIYFFFHLSRRYHELFPPIISRTALPRCSGIQEKRKKKNWKIKKNKIIIMELTNTTFHILRPKGK